jgi:hypothetical protein
MVDKSRLLAPNLREMTLNVFTGNAHGGNHIARYGLSSQRQPRRASRSDRLWKNIAVLDTSNLLCRQLIRDHLVALRWMNPNAVIYLKEVKGQGTPVVDFKLCESGQRV